jgi:DNA modification methylase
VTWLDQIHVGDCRALMQRMIATGVRVNCIVTSPPYWGLRDYGVAGQFGLERTWLRHVARMRGTFRLARELLADDGVAWVNYGDSYNTVRVNGGVGENSTINGQRTQEEFRKASRAMKSRIAPPDVDGPNRRLQRGLKPKDLVGMPWRVAFALQGDGWYLRSDIIWHKPNPMPESILDRPTKAHEYVFLLSKSERYHYDATAIAEPATGNSHPRGDGVNPKARRNVVPAGWNTGGGSHSAKDYARAKDGLKDSTKFGRGKAWRNKQNESFSGAVADVVETRNARTVWTIPSAPFAAAHFATFPRELVRRCILAGSRPGDTVFDPFMGSGTVAEVALSLGRHYIGCELNPEYAAMFKQHRSQQTGFAL